MKTLNTEIMNTEKKLSDYLPFYLGQDAMYMVLDQEGYEWNGPYQGHITGRFIAEFQRGVYKDIKPILRRLSSMTEEERIEVASMVSPGEDPAWVKHMAATTVWYFKKGFWIFGDDWFTEGLIIDADTVK